MNEKEPQFLILPCKCCGGECRTFMIALINPVIKQLEEGGETLVPLVNFPFSSAQALVDKIRELVAPAGMVIR